MSQPPKIARYALILICLASTATIPPGSGSSGPAQPNVTVDDTRPPLGKTGVCDPSTEVSVKNHEGRPVTVTIHKVVITNGSRVSADHTVTLPAQGGEYQGCRSGTSGPGRSQSKI